MIAILIEKLNKVFFEPKKEYWFAYFFVILFSFATKILLGTTEMPFKFDNGNIVAGVGISKKTWDIKIT